MIDLAGSLRRVGDGRVVLVWLLFAWAILQEHLLLYGAGRLSSYLDRASPLHLALGVCALLLVVFGPRPILFLATSLVTSSLLWRTAAGTDSRLSFPAAELPIFVALPLGSLVLCLVVGGRDREEDLTRALIWCYRLVFLSAVGFATLHKINTDFFDPQLSCSTILSQTLPQWWHTPAALPALLVDPIDVVLSEAAMALLLLLYWPLGMLFTVGFTTGLAMVGPTVFTAVVLSAAPAFLRDTGSARCFALRGKRLYLLAAGTLAILLLVPAAYHGPATRPWPQFALYLVVAMYLSLAALGALSDDLHRWLDTRRRPRLRRKRSTGRAAPEPTSAATSSTLAQTDAQHEGAKSVPREPLGASVAAGLDLPSGRAFRVVLVGMAVVLAINGLSPYLGLKHHFSFAMLSNLRADDLRWNSMAVPSWVRVHDRDPFVHVDVARILVPPDDRSDRSLFLFSAGFAPYAFVERAEAHLRHGHALTLVARYRGQEYRFDDATTLAEVAPLLERLPPNRLWPELQALGPQPCVH
ncbi:MAG TPA: hypothetical protein VNB06_11455 [Thermoanaerobaculia bacterium]|nr:hypothetical protein [Thermoanaerobaculia bacterium]